MDSLFHIFVKTPKQLHPEKYIDTLINNEAEYLMKNYGDRGGCYPSRP